MYYKEAINFINKLQAKGIKPRLDNIALALSYFGQPQLHFSAIHIAGTNGKGSTAVILAKILETAGYKVGLFTSPHLHSVRERIQINSKLISKEEFAFFVKEIKRYLSNNELTYFEFLTLLCFIYFAENKVDLAVIETGMGGRLDATNLLLPKVSIITNIAIEHQRWLGCSLKNIAFEKAGIIKSKRPLLTGVTQKHLISLFSKICQIKKAPIYRLGKDIKHYKTKIGFNYLGIKKYIPSLSLNLFGPHQIKNATLALGAIELLENQGFLIEEKAIRIALKTVTWPGRWEVVNEKPKVVLDGAHNPAGISALKKTLSLCQFNNLILILGIMKDKNIKKMIKILFPLANILILTAPKIERAADPEFLKKVVQKYNQKIEIKTIPSIPKAIKIALSIAYPDDLVLITGSLYTVAEAREVFIKCIPE